MRHIALCLKWDLESLEENRMIMERKIELLTAFEKGKTVEIYHKPDGKWYKVNHDIWDFQDGTYRIKPIEDNAFKIGDVLVEKAEEGKANPKLYKCIDIGRNQVYYFEDGSVLAKELVNSKFINIADVLWFFTGVTSEDTHKLLNTTMETIREVQEYYKDSIRDITPMYSIGFRLPITNKETNK